MSDLKLNSVLMRNWAKFRSAHVQFPESGLVLVTGINTASAGKMQSVGSGKTSLGETIGRTLFGVKTERYPETKNCSSDESGDTYVKVTATYAGKPLVVELGYKCPELSQTGEALRFSYDGAKPVERAKVEQTREELSALIGVTPTLAEWTIFIDGDNLKFNKLSHVDSVELVMAALKQPPWSIYHERSKKSVTELKKVIAKETGALDQIAQNSKDSEESVYSAKANYDAAKSAYEARKKAQKTSIDDVRQKIADKNTGIETARKRQKEISKEIEKVAAEKGKTQHGYQIRRQDLDEAIRSKQAGLRPLLEAWQKKKETVALKAEAHRVITGVQEMCPTCERPWHSKPNSKTVALKFKDWETADEAEKVAEKKYDAVEQQVEDLRAELRDLNQKISLLDVQFSVARLSHEHETLNGSQNRYLREIAELEARIKALEAGVSDETVKQAEATLTERKRLQEETKQKLEEAAMALTNSKSALRVVDYWNIAFSPAGVPNMVLQDTIAPLNAEARRISSSMTGSSIAVQFETRRQLASGDQKSELIITVDNRLGSKKAKQNSKGEGGLSNFIVAETLASVGQIAKRIGFRWYDEVLPNQDPVVCRSVYSYLRETALKQGILIFLVDHNPAAANYADYFIQVEKTGDSNACNATVKWL